MTIDISADRIVLKGRCGVEEAEPLLTALLDDPARSVAIEAEKVHTALWQVLLATRPQIEGVFGDTFVARHILSMLRDQPKTPTDHATTPGSGPLQRLDRHGAKP